MPGISAQYSSNAFHPQKGFRSASPQNTPERWVHRFCYVLYNKEGHVLVTCSKRYHTASIIKEGSLHVSLMFCCDVFVSKKVRRFHHGSVFFPYERRDYWHQKLKCISGCSAAR